MVYTRLRAQSATVCNSFMPIPEKSYRNVAAELNPIYGHPLPPFAQFAKPMTATLADLRELARALSAFAAFQGHFASTFEAIILLSKKIILATYGEPTLRNLARLSPSRFRRPATNLKLSILSLSFCQRP